jgi:hypothetical protein
MLGVSHLIVVQVDIPVTVTVLGVVKELVALWKRG